MEPDKNEPKRNDSGNLHNGDCVVDGDGGARFGAHTGNGGDDDAVSELASDFRDILWPVWML